MSRRFRWLSHATSSGSLNHVTGSRRVELRPSGGWLNHVTGFRWLSYVTTESLVGPCHIELLAELSRAVSCALTRHVSHLLIRRRAQRVRRPERCGPIVAAPSARTCRLGASVITSATTQLMLSGL